MWIEKKDGNHCLLTSGDLLTVSSFFVGGGGAGGDCMHSCDPPLKRDKFSSFGPIGKREK